MKHWRKICNKINARVRILKNPVARRRFFYQKTFFLQFHHKAHWLRSLLTSRFRDIVIFSPANGLSMSSGASRARTAHRKEQKKQNKPAHGSVACHPLARYIHSSRLFCDARCSRLIKTNIAEKYLRIAIYRRFKVKSWSYQKIQLSSVSTADRWVLIAIAGHLEATTTFVLFFRR